MRGLGKFGQLAWTGRIVRKTDFVILIGACVDVECVETCGMDRRGLSEIDADDGRLAVDIDAAFAAADACIAVGELTESLLVEVRR